MRERLKLDVSKRSMELIQRALHAHLVHLISQASGLEALEASEELAQVKGEYRHTVNLLKKMLDGRSIVEG